MYTDGDNMKDNFFSQNGFHSEMFYEHFLYLNKVYIAIYPPLH